MSIQERLDPPAERTAAEVAPPRPAAPPAAPPEAVTDTRLIYVAPASLRPGPPPLPAGPGGPQGPNEPTAFGSGPPAFIPPPPPGVPAYRSTYLDYLPGVYSDNEFLARFLLIFETILSPISRTVDNIPHLFDPDLTPRDLLPWLASWLGLVMDERWPEERRRDLVGLASDLFRWRGTRRGMQLAIRLYTGLDAEIIEPTLSQVGARRDLGYRFIVRLRVPRGQDVDLELLRRIIDIQKPAFTAATVELQRS
ncbi:MAG: hypothetical protein IT303_18750 [Dehalococcoidia bacterium]|nr:hypothetical protein [Dehalococcoidia bacterium]